MRRLTYVWIPSNRLHLQQICKSGFEILELHVRLVELSLCIFPDMSLNSAFAASSHNIVIDMYHFTMQFMAYVQS